MTDHINVSQWGNMGVSRAIAIHRAKIRERSRPKSKLYNEIRREVRK